MSISTSCTYSNLDKKIMLSNKELHAPTPKLSAHPTYELRLPQQAENSAPNQKSVPNLKQDPSPHLRTPPQFKTHNPNLRTPPPTLEPTTSELRLPNYQNQPSTSENLAFKHRTPFHHQPKNSVSNLRSTPASELCPNLKPRPPT